MRPRHFAILLWIPALLVAGSVLAKGDPAAGQEKSTACQACHGADGNGIAPLYPKLAGQYEDYLAKVLEDYRSGARANAIMAGFATTLSDEDIADLAAYFASLPTSLVDLDQP